MAGTWPRRDTQRVYRDRVVPAHCQLDQDLAFALRCRQFLCVLRHSLVSPDETTFAEHVDGRPEVEQ